MNDLEADLRKILAAELEAHIASVVTAKTRIERLEACLKQAIDSAPFWDQATSQDQGKMLIQWRAALANEPDPFADPAVPDATGQP